MSDPQDPSPDPAATLGVPTSAREPRELSARMAGDAVRRVHALDGVPADSRAARDDSTMTGLDDDVLRRVRGLNAIAEQRGQKLAQLALQWVLRDPRVTSAVIGASSVEQLDTNLDALQGPPLTDDELAAIDEDAVEAGVNLWAESTAE